ncbi:MAG: phage terminase small subunit [Solirubrobacteraceae bacterium]
MAGPAPKDPSQRRRRNVPERGEWISIPPLDGTFKAPSLPKRGKGQGVWSGRTKRAWSAWWADPAVQMWSNAERDTVVDLAYIHEEWVRGDNRLISEVRLRMDGLGLTPKGKKDLRWKVIDGPPETTDADTALIVHTGSSRERLRAVDPTFN